MDLSILKTILFRNLDQIPFQVHRLKVINTEIGKYIQPTVVTFQLTLSHVISFMSTNIFLGLLSVENIKFE